MVGSDSVATPTPSPVRLTVSELTARQTRYPIADNLNDLANRYALVERPCDATQHHTLGVMLHDGARRSGGSGGHTNTYLDYRGRWVLGTKGCGLERGGKEVERLHRLLAANHSLDILNSDRNLLRAYLL